MHRIHPQHFCGNVARYGIDVLPGQLMTSPVVGQQTRRNSCLDGHGSAVSVHRTGTRLHDLFYLPDELHIILVQYNIRSAPHGRVQLEGDVRGVFDVQCYSLGLLENGDQCACILRYHGGVHCLGRYYIVP